MSLTSHDPSSRRRTQGYLLLFALLVVGIGAGGYFFHRHFTRHFRARAEQELASIADLKVNELVLFRRERLADAAVLSKSATLAGLVRRIFATPTDPVAPGQLQEWLGQYVAPFQYDRAFLLDVQGVERLAVPTALGQRIAVPSAAVTETLRSGQIVIQDFYRDEQDRRVYLTLLIPIREEAPAGRMLGVVGLRIDPTESLYPTINRWPVPSRTAEIHLVRRDGDAATYLNELRTRKGAALTERVPLTETRRTAVMAVLGREGIVEGIDGPGNAVLGFVRAVPDSPWFVALRIETTEVNAPAREQMWLTIVLMATLLAGGGAGLGLMWRQQHLRYYREMADAVEMLRESEERHRTVLENVGEGIGLVNPNEEFTFANPAAEEVFGMPLGGLLGRSLRELTPPEEFERIREQTGKRQAGEKSVYEIIIRRADGEARHLLVTAVPQFDRQGEFAGTFGVFRDITERRRAQEALRHSEASLQAILRSTADGLLAVSNENQVLLANGRFAEMWRIPPELLAARDDAALLQHVLGQLRDPPAFLQKVQELYRSEAESFDTVFFKDGRVFDRLSRPLLEMGKVSGRVWSFRDVTQQRQAEAERERLVDELRQTLAEVKTLGGLLPICAGCKNIRDDTGYWSQVEVYIQQHTDAKFSHGMCPECLKKYYPDLDLT